MFCVYFPFFTYRNYFVKFFWGGPAELGEGIEDVEQKSRREDVLNQILLLLNTAIGRDTKNPPNNIKS